MKKKPIIIIIVCLCTVVCVSGQEVNIQQISSTGIESYFPIQTSIPGQTNVASISQLGTQNKITVNQTKDVDLLSANQAYSFQQGNLNQTDATQKGSGNTLLNFQLGYILNGLSGDPANNISLSTGIEQSLSGNTNNLSGLVANGTGNILNSLQYGKFNRLMAIQSGDNNKISAEQSGDYNDLFILQQGAGNQVADFKQVNNSGNTLFDVVTQIGANNTFSASEMEGSRLNGNSFSQEGTNLSLTISSSLITTTGGIKVTQTGQDMQIVIDQSFFP